MHSLLPRSSTPKPLLYDGPFAASSRRPKCLNTITAISKAKSENKADEDDYYATLKALNSKGRFPRKSLGQHYMLNSSVNEELVAAADVQEGDLVVEIGPGTGSLTNVLVNSGATVLAIEKDPYMAALVTERFSSLDCVKVLQEDFTKCHIRSHLSTVSQSARNSSGVKPQYAKEEAAVRMVDSSLRSSEYRPINIFINFYSDPEYKFKVPRTNFFPQPKVDAAVVSFRLKQPVDYPPVSSAKSFFSMVNCAFNGKRKMLRKTLQHICPSLEIEEALVSAGLPSTSRPEELALDDFVRLHNSIVKA
ncbi:ribosomal RNA small subunit methyltransferase, chloroplastic-like isoform X2 [Lycium ferocissimum]|uniref:ribosomal RNA small subunit methyltransferase, chloroplastic-like isoform X2 n=1 Tax=Lycium ferocissimum TaxID=112874 RepID=UPI002814FEF5|nr:ribosomal RNA small subunit methyltransferase, chloroplastic-like isoform X2 [Lycium ferocissimum]